MYVVAAVSLFLVAVAVWLVLTGRKPPGILGRGLTRADDQRLRRSPPIYFRAMGLFVAVAALDGFFLVWVISLLPRPSTPMLFLLVALIFVLLFLTGASLAWLIFLSARYRLFRWDKP